MAKNMTSNKELVRDELNFMLSRLRGAIAYEGKDKCSIYLAGVHKETYETLTSMGIKWDVKRWCTFLFAPKKGTKAYTALFNGSKVLDEAKAYKEAKVAAAKAEKAEKAAKAKAKAEKKAAKEKEAKAKAEKKAAAPKAEKPKKSATVKKSAAEKPAVNEVAPEPAKVEEKAEA